MSAEVQAVDPPPVVVAGARVCGAVADAVVAVDAAEHDRRMAYGLGGVVELGLLDALMCLPAGAAIPVGDVGEVALWHLRRAAAGCVQWLPGGLVRRLLVPACSVELVIVASVGWRSGLRRAAAFEPFARRVVHLTRPPRRPAAITDIEWQAAAASVGLWVTRPDGQTVEIVPPAAFTQRYVKPAGWRFTEHAYAVWTPAGVPCGCGRRIRVTPSVQAAGPITCQLCGTEFTPTSPDQTGKSKEHQR